jgi:hypothetical protein
MGHLRPLNLTITTNLAPDRGPQQWHAPRVPTPRFRSVFSPATVNSVPPVPPLSYFNETPLDDSSSLSTWHQEAHTSPDMESSGAEQNQLPGMSVTPVVLAQSTVFRPSSPLTPISPASVYSSTEVVPAGSPLSRPDRIPSTVQSFGPGAMPSGTSDAAQNDVVPHSWSSTAHAASSCPSILSDSSSPRALLRARRWSLSTSPALSPRFMFPRMPPTPPKGKIVREKRRRISWPDIQMSPAPALKGRNTLQRYEGSWTQGGSNQGHGIQSLVKSRRLSVLNLSVGVCWSSSSTVLAVGWRRAVRQGSLH